MTDTEAMRVAELVNRHGIDQLTASQMVWAPELIHAPIPAPDAWAPAAEQRRWAGARARQIVRERLDAVIRWLGIESDYMDLYRKAKERTLP